MVLRGGSGGDGGRLFGVGAVPMVCVAASLTGAVGVGMI